METLPPGAWWGRVHSEHGALTKLAKCEPVLTSCRLSAGWFTVVGLLRGHNELTNSTPSS
jgi:hypothetical protein